MKAELQGEGTYAYECNEPDCCYCRVMRLNVVPEAIELLVIAESIAVDVVEDKSVEVELTPYQKRKHREFGIAIHRPGSYKVGVLKWHNFK